VPPRKTSSISTFEGDLERLTAIVDRLESGNIPLEEMLKLYEEGVALSKSLSGVLSEAELRVEKLRALHEEQLPAGAEPDLAASEDDDELLF
jgi:exodeoxyribonuclease VII small subunit